LSAGTANGVTYLNGSKSLTSGSAITFDGTNFATTGTATATKLIPTGTSVTGNGLYLPAANALGLSTNGTNAVYIDASQNVGIGVTPTYKLDVTGTSSVERVARLTSVGTDVNAILELTPTGVATGIVNATTTGLGLAVAGSTKVTVLASGNVGIGVTPSATWNSDKAIQIGDASNTSFLSSGTTSGAMNLGKNAYSVGSSPKYVGNGYATNYYQSAGTHVWQTAASNSGGAGAALTWTSAMTLDASGNLSIGTTSTSQKLQIANGNIYISTTNYLMWNSGGSYAIDSDASTRLSFYAGSGTERMRIDSVGNAQFQAGAVMPYAPAPTGIAAATTLTNAQIQGQIISATGTTYTITMPLGTTMETLATWATTNIAYDFFVINTASGTVTMAANTGVTTLGTLTIATGISAHFRIRRTAANTFVLYRLV